jgi:hypothetical protein
MRTHGIILAKIFIISCTALALPPRARQSIEEVCRDPAGRTNDARVRVAWTDVETSYDDIRISYCVLHGDATARLEFERDAEIVYVGLATVDGKTADRRTYTFVVTTSNGTQIRQGPAQLQPLAKLPLSCRVDVCQFFTERGERVVSVGVEAGDQTRRR